MATSFPNRSALKAGLTAWMADSTIASDTLDRAIDLVESDLRRRLRTFHMEMTEDLILDAETLIVPSRFLAVRRAYIPGYRPMDYLSPELLIEYQVDRPTAGVPERYTLEGREDKLPILRFAPLPAASYTFRLTYLRDPALLGDSDCNSILDHFPDVYLYGCLSHLGDYVRNKERLPDWLSRYETIIDDIIDSDLTDKVDGSVIYPRSVYRGA